MKRKILLIAAGCILLSLLANAQISLPAPFNAPIPGTVSPDESVFSPTAWRQDSSWYLHWNSIGNSWQRDRRTLRTFNGSGMLTELLAIRWDYNLSEWINDDNYSNEYYSDHTTPKNMFRMVWDPSDQAWVEVYHAFYASNGDITEYEAKAYDAATNSFTGGNRTTYTYSPGSMQELHKNLDPATQTWKNFSRITITYDGQGNAISSLVEVWIEGLSAWMNAEYYEIAYTPLGEILEMIFSVWNTGTSDWNFSSRMTYEYNSSGWLVANYIYSWDEMVADWKNSVRINYHYDENGHKTQAESYEWDDAQQAWDNDRKEVYNYHANGMLHETLSSTWIAAISQFMDYEYSCRDENGNETETWHKDINYQTNEYYDGSRTVSTYADGLLTEALYQTLELPGSTWIPSWRKTNTWDGNRNLTVELYEDYDHQNLAWVNTSRSEHFYSSYIGIPELQGLNGLCMFRNPLHPGETIQCPGLQPEEVYHFRLITMQGQTVMDNTLPGNVTLVMPESLSAGSYILRITGSDGTAISGKVTVVQK